MKSTMKILSVVEATNVNAVAKLTIDFFRTARELSQSHSDFPAVTAFQHSGIRSLEFT